MSIIYKDIHEFNKKDLEELFLSVKWASGNYSDKLVIAMKNYKSVFTAWDGDKLVGLISSMDDGVMTAYVHYLLVNPDYQGKGIGKHLIEMMAEHYKDYLKIVLIAYNETIDFYKHCGFKVDEDSTPMFITSL